MYLRGVARLVFPPSSWRMNEPGNLLGARTRHRRAERDRSCCKISMRAVRYYIARRVGYSCAKSRGSCAPTISAPAEHMYLEAFVCETVVYKPRRRPHYLCVISLGEQEKEFPRRALRGERSSGSRTIERTSTNVPACI